MSISERGKAIVWGLCCSLILVFALMSGYLAKAKQELDPETNLKLFIWRV
jgi:hypothetical protein